MPETETIHGSQEQMEADCPDRKRIASELYQNPVWKPLGPYRVSSELFLDVVFTDSDTVDAVRDCSRALAIPEEEIAGLWNAFLARHGTVRRTSRVLGFVDYAETSVDGQTVILKYAQIEGRYDCKNTIPTLTVYPNGCLSNEWSFLRDVRRRLDPAYCAPAASR